MSVAITDPLAFADLALPSPILEALNDVGYEMPSPIQAQTIPALLQGRDVLGQAQTGTGKTAAFALPILARLDVSARHPQALVLVPTRELALQVAEAFQRYAAHLTDFHVLPIYGGQDYSIQIRALQRGVHVIVATPGRIMDHMRRGTLRLESIATLVLDEADEMLRMGFIDDIEWILQHIPEQRQTALFSATLPTPIRHIAEKHLRDPLRIAIKTHSATATTIRQRYWMVDGSHKLDALTRLLEIETFDAMIIFVRTKTATGELAEKLEARGYAAAALSGDMPQKQRERTIEQLKAGKLDILIATDVAARGLDVERITHVVNYDIPYDCEAYVHRIGRTGRAGRQGEAILFVAPREKRMLAAIEKTIQQKIEHMEMPSVAAINDKRVARFGQRITDALTTEDLTFYRELIEDYQRQHDIPALEIAAALARLLQGRQPLLLQEREDKKTSARQTDETSKRGRAQKSRRKNDKEPGMDRYRLAVGACHGVKPSQIVGAIANEAGLDSQYIGRIVIHDNYSTVDLPEGMPAEIFRHLQKTRVAGQAIKLTKYDAETPEAFSSPKRGKARHTSAKS